MCNEARRRIALGQLREDWGETRIPLRFPEGAPNMAPLDSIRITDPSVIIRAAAPPPGSERAERIEAELVTRRWSWPGPTGKPVYNFRSEGRALDGAPGSPPGKTARGFGRCLIPVDGFYEFTAPSDPTQKRKDKWVFTVSGEAWFCIGGLWRTDAKVGEAWTMLTTAPGPDIAPYHDRQVVIVARADWGRWLDPAVRAGDLIRSLPAGTLEVSRVT